MRRHLAGRLTHPVRGVGDRPTAGNVEVATARRPASPACDRHQPEARVRQARPAVRPSAQGVRRWHGSATAATCSNAPSAASRRSRSRSSSPGPGVYICDECIDLCNEIIEEELAESGEVQVGRAAQADGDLRSSSTSTWSGRTRRRRRSPSRSTTTTSGSRPSRRRSRAGSDAGRAGQVQHPADRPHRAAARPTWRRRWPGCSTSRSRSPTPPRSPRPATSARTSRTSCSS